MKTGKKTICKNVARLISYIILTAALFLLSACAESEEFVSSETDNAVIEISMWVFPVGDFKDPATVESFLAAFNEKYPDIRVNVDYLNYASGDNQISAAIACGTAPDIVLEGPERIVANWGAKGVMADLSDLWTTEAEHDISESNTRIKDACRGQDGKYYEYPLCQTTHCMGINYEIFEKADALQYLDLETRTWTSDGFMKACAAIAASGLVETPGVIYCGGQGGDQGTRALVTNLCGARFTNEAYTAYTINSPEGIRALEILKDMVDAGMLSCDTHIQASDELKLFTQGKTAMTLAWNYSNEKQYASDVEFTPYAVAFPTPEGMEPRLCGGIWGFGVFDSGDAERIEASKTLIRFLCDDEVQGRKSVRATGFCPVRSSFKDVYDGTPEEQRINNYRIMMKYMGDYYNITPGWAAQRTVWWIMLQQVFSGSDIKISADEYVMLANNSINNTPLEFSNNRIDADARRILFISSYSLSYPNVSDQIDGIRSGLKPDEYLHCEFMDSSSAGGDVYVEAFYNYITFKYSKIGNIAAIIVGGDDALQMALKYHQGFFRNIPIIYEAVHSQMLTELADAVGMSGIHEPNTIMDNIDLARSINPAADKILAISDGSVAGQALNSYLMAIRSKYRPLEMEILNTSLLTKEEIIARVSEAGDDTILLYLIFTKDFYENSYRYDQALGIITDNARTPVYTMSWMGNGSLGGITIDHFDFGKIAGEMASDIIEGNIPADENEDNKEYSKEAAFDVSVMKKYGISKPALPKNAIYYNDVDDRLKLLHLVGVLVVVTIILAVFLFGAKRENIMGKAHERDLEESSMALKAEAELDDLTSLGNRRLFDRELGKCVASGRAFSLMIFDIDKFKSINDLYGHLVGDAVLKETGKRLNAVKSRAFVPYRYGGDEFAIIFFPSLEISISMAMSRVMSLFDDAMPTSEGELPVSISLGSADFPADADSTEDLIHCSDQALYAVKGTGKDSAKRYSEL